MGRRRTPIIISTVVVISVLIGIALAVFFLVPRNPSETFGDPTYTGLIDTATEFSITVSVCTLFNHSFLLSLLSLIKIYY
jgi:hypothetical protein